MPSLRALALIAVSAVLGACAAIPPPARDLVVASWNLEHLAERDGVGCRPRVEADYAALRAYAAGLNADVIAFQEVESAAAAARVFPPEAYDIVISQRPDSGRGGDCRGLPGQQIQKQDVGFAVRKGIAFRRNPDLQSLALGDPDLRWGVDITLLGDRPLRLLNVHLKSGCSAGNSAPACGILVEQAPIVEGWIDDRARSGEAAILLGDFNRRLAIPADSLWADWDDNEPVGSALILAGQGAQPRCDPRYHDFIDHIVLNDAAAKRFAPGSFREMTYAAGAALSDHCPITVRMPRP